MFLHRYNNYLHLRYHCMHKEYNAWQNKNSPQIELQSSTIYETTLRYVHQSHINDRFALKTPFYTQRLQIRR